MLAPSYVGKGAPPTSGVVSLLGRGLIPAYSLWCRME